MAKAQDAFRTISEVSEWLDTPTHVLRFWESKFSQIKPVKGAGGRRYYRPSDMDLLGGIKQLLHEDGLTIKGTQKLLREKGVSYVAGLGQSRTTEPQDSSAVPAAIARITRLKTAGSAHSDNQTSQVAATATDPSGLTHAHPLPSKELPAAMPRLIGRAPVDARGLHDRAGQIAPLLAKLETLRGRMQRST